MHFVHQMFVEIKRAVRPEFLARLGLDKAAVEQEACKHCADGQYTERHQHRQRAFMRMIAAGAVLGGCGGFVNAVLDMLALDPAGFPEKRQEH